MACLDCFSSPATQPIWRRKSFYCSEILNSVNGWGPLRELLSRNATLWKKRRRRPSDFTRRPLSTGDFSNPSGGDGVVVGRAALEVNHVA